MGCWQCVDAGRPGSDAQPTSFRRNWLRRRSPKRFRQCWPDPGSGISGAPPTEIGPSGLEGWTALFASFEADWAAGGEETGGADAAASELCKDSIFAVNASIWSVIRFKSACCAPILRLSSAITSLARCCSDRTSSRASLTSGDKPCIGAGPSTCDLAKIVSMLVQTQAAAAHKPKKTKRTRIQDERREDLCKMRGNSEAFASATTSIILSCHSQILMPLVHAIMGISQELRARYDTERKLAGSPAIAVGNRLSRF
ncbi:hypothetical protein ABIF68_003056 [Bradyrhizobium japonicum]